MAATGVSGRYGLQAAIIKALGHPLRLAMVDLLRDGERSAGDLCRRVGTSNANISKHLTHLKTAGIVAVRRDGPTLYYSLRIGCVVDFFDCVEKVLARRRDGAVSVGCCPATPSRRAGR